MYPSYGYFPATPYYVPAAVPAKYKSSPVVRVEHGPAKHESSSPIVRQVWDYNVHEELSLIYYSVCQFNYKIVSLDTEFPGTIFDIPSHVPKHEYASAPEEYYATLKKNTDALKLIQLGLTLSDADGNYMQAWQFNFRDFDPALDLHNPDSISMLRKQGIDFSIYKLRGVNSAEFFVGFEPILEILRQNRAVWVTFQGSSDFAFLIKNMTRKYLPEDVGKFMELVGAYFGYVNFDLKVVTRSIGVHGGLEKVAKQLGLERCAGIRHHAGSDSFLVMQVFMKMLKNHEVSESRAFSHQLYGLTKPKLSPRAFNGLTRSLTS